MADNEIGIVGAGKWFFRIRPYLKEYGFDVSSVVDILSYEEVEQRMNSFGLDRKDYYRIENGKRLPKEFLEKTDIIHISSPNKYHKQQIEDSLEAGKFTIIEKALACNREDFANIRDKIRGNSWTDKTILNIHYPFKPLSWELHNVSPFTKLYGKVEHVELIFHEELYKSDMNRTWIFEPENGGIAMDWVTHTTAMLKKHTEARLYFLGEEPALHYNRQLSEFPCGISAEFKIESKYYSTGATANISVGKGFPKTDKKMTFHFEDGIVELELDFVNSMWHKREGGEITHTRVINNGLKSYGNMARNMSNVINGMESFYSMDDMDAIYSPIFPLNKVVFEKHSELERAVTLN